MKKLFSNKDVWIWGLASVLVITMAILGTMLWRQYYQHHETESRVADQEKSNEKKPSKYSYSKWREKMGFTEGQEEKLKELWTDYRQETKSIFEDLRENQEHIFIALNEDIPNDDTLTMLAEETGRLHAALRKETIKHLIAIKAITNQEQYEKMAEMMKMWMFPGNFGQSDRWSKRKDRSDYKEDCDDDQ